MGQASCNLCPEERRFAVPWSGTTAADAISAELMKAHLLDAHNVEVR